MRDGILEKRDPSIHSLVNKLISPHFTSRLYDESRGGLDLPGPGS